MFAVVVTFQIEPGQMQAFMPLMLENARASLSGEEGCHQFDVATDVARPNELFLYELYTDATAFELHKNAPHFKAFGAVAGPMIADKTITTYAQVQQ
ncbi:putative quinol monooxygenase [Sulfitobacter mediterraneus]|uniref:putative quinol monooxygenase n=1 Tax=Sulfitobacter mediterraneus TaxID=83219 RepID=UPI0021A27862|nr:putative quinol monooxygenase [Sulfitobacter mediterraneus]UWR13342.1 antibiotic biosynthesis monooxygenase [Sulfitobacter mediterraneus]